MLSARIVLRLFPAVLVVGCAAFAPARVFAIGLQNLKTIVVSPIGPSILGDDSGAKVAERFGSFDFTYDPSQLETGRSVLATYHDLRLHSKAMRSEIYRERLRSEVVVPISTDDPSDLATLRTFGKRDLEIFLSRKTRYLERLATILNSLRLPPEFINRVLSLVNDQFFKHADVVARANSNSTAISLNIGAGANVPEWFLLQLRKLPLLSGIPEKAGFYIGFSTGLALAHTMLGGRPRFRIEPVAEFRRSERIIGALLSVNTSISVSTELSIPKRDATNGSHSSFISFAGTALSSSPSSLGVSRVVVGIGLPPFGGLFTVIQGKNHSFRADGTGVEKLMRYVKDYFAESSGSSPKLACSALFGAR